MRKNALRTIAFVLFLLGTALPSRAQTVIAGDLGPYNGFQASTATGWATGAGAPVTVGCPAPCDPANAVAFSIPSGGSSYLMTQFKVAINWSAGTNGATVGLYVSPNGNNVDAINSATLLQSFTITSPAASTGLPGQLVTQSVNPPILLTPGNTYFLEMTAPAPGGSGTDFGWQWNSIGRTTYYAEFLPCIEGSSCWFAETGVVTPAFEVDGTLAPGPFAYVGNQTDDTVSVIDTSNGTVVSTITLGCGSDCGDSPAGLAVTPNGRFVYVAIPGKGTVIVIDTSTNTVSTTIPMCECTSSPNGVAITPDGTRAYVTDTAGAGKIWVIDTSSNAVTQVGSGDVVNPNGPIAITPDGSAVFYTFGSNSVGRINTTTNTHTTTLTVGSNPTGVAITPDGTQIYVTNSGGNTVSVIPNVFPNFTPIASVTVGTGPFSVAITPNGKSAYVVNQTDKSISVINTTSNTATTPITGLGSTPNEIAITPDGTTAYVPIGSSNVVTAIYTSTNTTVQPNPNITVGNGPFGIAIGPAPASEQFILDGSDQTITASFYNGGASISYHFPAGYCNPAPCTLTITATDTPDSVWQTESANYPGTDIAPVIPLPGGGNAGGDGVVYTVICTDGNSNPCSDPSNLDYTATLSADSNVDICSASPALGKEDTTFWKNILATCIFHTDPGYGTSGNSKGGPSHWAVFYHVSGTPSAVVNIVTPPNGATYVLGETVLANYSCTGTFVDCAGTVTDGDPIDTSSLGMKVFDAEAAVTSGPTAKASSTYNVTSSYQFIGFKSPINNSPVLNIAKAGQAIPVQFQVLDASGNPVLGLTMPPVSMTFVPATCASLDTTSNTNITVNAAGNSGFQDLGGGNYVEVWKTSNIASGTCGQLQVNIGDGVVHTADFKFK